MGLDIYLLRASKPTDIDFSQPIYAEELRDNPCLNMFSKDKFKDKKMYSQTLLDNGVWADIIYSYFERGLFLKDHGYDENYIAVMSDKIDDEDWRNSDKFYFNVYKDEDDARNDKPLAENIEVDGEVFLNRYYIEEVENMLLVELEEIAYQRKHISEHGWDLMPENCSFYDNKNVIRKLCEEGGLDDDFMRLWVDGKTVFHPWW